MHPVGRMGEYLVQEAPVSHTLLGQPGELTREGLESRDKTHTLVPSLQGQGDLRSKGSESVGLFIQPIPLKILDLMEGRLLYTLHGHQVRASAWAGWRGVG